MCTLNLNKLCQLTPYGYMITIPKEHFETEVQQVNDDNYSKYVVEKDVDVIFRKICKSIELYHHQQIPIITEFLEF